MFLTTNTPTETGSAYEGEQQPRPWACNEKEKSGRGCSSIWALSVLPTQATIQYAQENTPFIIFKTLQWCISYKNLDTSGKHTPGSWCNSAVGQTHLSKSCLRSSYGYLSRPWLHSPAHTYSQSCFQSCPNMDSSLTNRPHVTWRPCSQQRLSQSKHWWPKGRQSF